MISTTQTSSCGLDIRVPDENGVNQPAAHVGFAMRPGQHISFTVDVFSPSLVEAGGEAVKQQINAFLTDCAQQAAQAGFPIG